jgi:hypothetical protein
VAGLDLSLLTPADALVALASFPRRYRAELNPLPDDEQAADRADEQAGRLGPEGVSALDVVSDVTRTWGLLSHELRRVQTLDQPTLHPAALDGSARHWDTPAPDSIDEALVLLGHEADALADAIRSYPTADDWARRAHAPGGASATALDLVREGVRVGSEGLGRVAEILAAVRRR